MTDFFWLTLVASILGLLYAFSKGEGDGWGIAKVVLAAIIMLALVVNRFFTGEDALVNEEQKKQQYPINSPRERPDWMPDVIDVRVDKNDPTKANQRRSFWQKELDKQQKD